METGMEKSYIFILVIYYDEMSAEMWYLTSPSQPTLKSPCLDEVTFFVRKNHWTNHQGFFYDEISSMSESL